MSIEQRASVLRDATKLPLAGGTMTGSIITPNPVLVSDDFSGTAGAALVGRMPIVGPYAWSATGAGFAGAYAGNGILGTTGGDTYFVAHASQTPWEVTATFKSTVGAPAAVIAVLLDTTLGEMFHVNFTGAIESRYWHSGVAAIAPVFQQSSPTVTLLQDVSYVARLVLNPPYADASIETVDGVVLITHRTYEPLMASIIGPYAFVQSSGSTLTYSSFHINSKPTAPNFLYGRSVSGIEGTPTGAVSPAAGRFTSLHVSPAGGVLDYPRGVFSSLFDGTPEDRPGFYSLGTGGLLVRSLTSGYGTTLTVMNGEGGYCTATFDGYYVFTLGTSNGGTFLSKPWGANPYFADRLGVGVAPTAVLHLKAGTASANTAPLKFNSGTLNTTAEVGAVEFLGDAFYGTITTGAARKTFAFLESPTFTGQVAIANTVTAAAAVASTHKVTMVIGGVTYYLLATNV